MSVFWKYFLQDTDDIFGDRDHEYQNKPLSEFFPEGCEFYLTPPDPNGHKGRNGNNGTNGNNRTNGNSGQVAQKDDYRKTAYALAERFAGARGRAFYCTYCDRKKCNKRLKEQEHFRYTAKR